eukprot:COSAG01_NODE_11164_length_1991_cov_21.080338_1_plen_101_part_00
MDLHAVIEDERFVWLSYARRFHPLRSILTEIYLCHTSSCHEILRGWKRPCRSSLYAGGELFDAIVEHCKQGKTYTEQHAAVIVAQVLRAVEHCHLKQVSG